jgi:hypothetical protein
MNFRMPTDEAIHTAFEKGEAAVRELFHHVADQMAELARQLAKLVWPQTAAPAVNRPRATARAQCNGPHAYGSLVTSRTAVSRVMKARP